MNRRPLVPYTISLDLVLNGLFFLFLFTVMLCFELFCCAKTSPMALCKPTIIGSRVEAFQVVRNGVRSGLPPSFMKSIFVQSRLIFQKPEFERGVGLEDTHVLRRHYYPRRLWHGASPSTSSLSSSSSGKASLEQNNLVTRQSEISSRIAEKNKSSSLTETTSEDLSTEFLNHQKETFDSMAQFFAENGTVGPDLIPIYETMARKIVQSMKDERERIEKRRKDINANDIDNRVEIPFRFLDVATGTGALWPFLLEQANNRNITINIHAVDLAPRMVHHAQEHAQRLLTLPQHRQHNIQVTVSDILDYKPALFDDTDAREDVDPSKTWLQFDGIVCNACWGNFQSQSKVLQHLTTNLLVSDKRTNNATKPFGKLFVTHPLGAKFVQQLHESDPRTVPHVLPQQWSYQDLIGIPLEVEEFIQELSMSDRDAAVPFYYCALRRVRHLLLPQVWRFRGPVASGYGRGGKKLGFPTANLAASQFLQNALEDLQTGVYVGWAQVEFSDDSDTVQVHKAVVNVGYSPTFEGQTNKEKIIEAHLMPEESGLKDFYGKPMRLVLLAYLRPEQKFASFPDLIAQIQADVQDAKDLLDRHPVLTKARMDAFVASKAGTLSSSILTNELNEGNSSSWECQDMKEYLDAVMEANSV